MSSESAKVFIERLRTDEEFVARIKACPDADARLALARTEGFDFTPAEITAQAGELSDDELDGVAGGVFDGLPCFTDSIINTCGK
jgi:predicted ribosomally synthesized peptide with nif11-like leader